MKLAVLIIGLALAAGPASSAEPRVESRVLDNGIRAVVVSIEGSAHVSLFTFLPLGLASDGPGQAQWSHLVEHLAIRSTIAADSTAANGETLPDHMRLDWYGTTATWQEGLAHHRRWLEGARVTPLVLEAEKIKANAEADFAAKNLATHKFAVAAWNQVYRHGRKHAAVRGDLARASFAEIEQYQQERLAVLDRAVVCAVGGLDPKSALPAIARQLGSLKSAAAPPAPVKPRSGRWDATWDLAARHWLKTWPIPATDSADYAALSVAAQLLAMRLYEDADLQRAAAMTLAGADLIPPEGNYFYISAALKPGATFAAVEEKIGRHLEALRSGGESLRPAPMAARQLAFSLERPTDPESIRAQAPPGVTRAMIEGNVGLQWGMQEFRHGRRRAEMAKKLSALDPGAVHRAVQANLAEEKAATVTISRAAAPPR